MNWDFSNFNILTFSYKQITTNKTPLNQYDAAPLETYTELSGLLVVEVKDKNSADVTLKNAKITAFIKDSLGNRFDTRSQTIPDLVYLKGLKENGLVDEAYNKQTELFAKLLFPIINNSPADTCIIQIPLDTSFDIEGNLVEIKGKNTIDFASINAEYFKLKTHAYAERDHIDVGNGKLYKCKIEGESDFKFNTQKKYFTNGNIKLNMLLKQKNDKVYKQRNEKYNRTKTVVDVDVDITLKLIKVD
ncbi:hypothetical protein [Winogradskyella sp.]|uniref:hypothetical protein n=1 Tax=Winogradskyella sp. TaxID=1883156 RepID=UPI001B0BFBBE|nr:hypothetical protein [Winogradskyella sp.]MBO6879446.1 hypothetical protein [Winogradskyella sp.]